MHIEADKDQRGQRMLVDDYKSNRGMANKAPTNGTIAGGPIVGPSLAKNSLNGGTQACGIMVGFSLVSKFLGGSPWLITFW